MTSVECKEYLDLFIVNQQKAIKCYLLIAFGIIAMGMVLIMGSFFLSKP